MEHLGERIVKLRTKRGWTRRALAIMAHLHEQHLAKIERGDRTRLEPETLVRIARALEVSLDYLAGLTDDPRPRKRLQAKKADSVSESESADLEVVDAYRQAGSIFL